MTRTLLALAAVAMAAAMAAACDNPGSTVKDLGPDAPACTVAVATQAQDACQRFQEAACLRMLECDLFPNRAGCDDWFAKTYGDCTKAVGTLDAAAGDAFVSCVCTLPNASCKAMEDLGIEVAVPDCKDF
jgi:hypothetical protein